MSNGATLLEYMQWVGIAVCTGGVIAAGAAYAIDHRRGAMSGSSRGNKRLVASLVGVAAIGALSTILTYVADDATGTGVFTQRSITSPAQGTVSSPGIFSLMMSGNIMKLIEDVITGATNVMLDGIKYFLGFVVQMLLNTGTLSSTGLLDTNNYAALVKAMLPAALLFAGALIVIAVIDGVIKADSAEIAKRVLLAPLVAAAAILAFGTILIVVLHALDAIGSSFIHAMMGTTAANPLQVVSAAFSTAGLTSIGAIIGGLSLAAMAITAVIGIFLELLLRASLILLLAAMWPMLVMGIIWRGTQSWVRHTIELIIAIAFVKPMIEIVFGLLMFALTRANPTTAGGLISSMGITAVLLWIGAMALPIALRMAPHASAAAAHYGSLSGKANAASSRVASGIGATAGSSSDALTALGTAGVAGGAGAGMAIGSAAGDLASAGSMSALGAAGGMGGDFGSPGGGGLGGGGGGGGGLGGGGGVGGSGGGVGEALEGSGDPAGGVGNTSSDAALSSTLDDGASEEAGELAAEAGTGLESTAPESGIADAGDTEDVAPAAGFIPPPEGAVVPPVPAAASATPEPPTPALIDALQNGGLSPHAEKLVAHARRIQASAKGHPHAGITDKTGKVVGAASPFGVFHSAAREEHRDTGSLTAAVVAGGVTAIAATRLAHAGEMRDRAARNGQTADGSQNREAAAAPSGGNSAILTEVAAGAAGGAVASVVTDGGGGSSSTSTPAGTANLSTPEPPQNTPPPASGPPPDVAQSPPTQSGSGSGTSSTSQDPVPSAGGSAPNAANPITGEAVAGAAGAAAGAGTANPSTPEPPQSTPPPASGPPPDVTQSSPVQAGSGSGTNSPSQNPAPTTPGVTTNPVSSAPSAGGSAPATPNGVTGGSATPGPSASSPSATSPISNASSSPASPTNLSAGLTGSDTPVKPAPVHRNANPAGASTAPSEPSNRGSNISPSNGATGSVAESRRPTTAPRAQEAHQERRENPVSMTEQEQPDAQRSTLEAHEARVQRFIQRYPDEDPEELRMHQIAIDRENNELPPEVEATLNFSDDEPLGD